MLLFLIGAVAACYMLYRDVVGATINDSVILSRTEVSEYEAREWECEPLKGPDPLWRCTRQIQIGL